MIKTGINLKIIEEFVSTVLFKPYTYLPFSTKTLHIKLLHIESRIDSHIRFMRTVSSLYDQPLVGACSQEIFYKNWTERSCPSHVTLIFEFKFRDLFGAFSCIRDGYPIISGDDN